MQNCENDPMPLTVFPVRLDTMKSFVAVVDVAFERGCLPVAELNVLLSPSSNLTAETILFNQSST